MARLRILSASEQVTQYLRDELRRGTWSEVMPGMDWLASELGVGIHTVGEALRQLEKEGLLVGQGHRRSRLIMQPKTPISSALRLRLLLFESSDAKEYYMVNLLHELREAGHDAAFASKTLLDLRMDTKRLARFVQHESANAWVVRSAPRVILQWFENQPIPAFAMFGRVKETSLASILISKGSVYVEIVHQLVSLGHRRVVFLTRDERRKPGPGLSERIFLSEMERHGIKTGKFNLPDWGTSPEDFHRYLDVLHAHTPPTAFIVSEPALLLVVQQYLALRGMRAPDHVSLICADPDKAFDWFRPAISHISWDHRVIVRRIVNWADNISHGKDDRRQSTHKAKLFQGGTIGRP